MKIWMLGHADLAAQAKLFWMNCQNILVVQLARILGRSPLKSAQTGQISNTRIFWDFGYESGPAFLPALLPISWNRDLDSRPGWAIFKRAWIHDVRR
jgi:hypothetical protein